MSIDTAVLIGVVSNVVINVFHPDEALAIRTCASAARLVFIKMILTWD